MRTMFAVLLVALLLPATARPGPIQDDPTKRDCDWLAIVPSTLASSLDPLRMLRAYQGYHPGIWTLEEIDASFGGHTPAHIRQALSYAYSSWHVRPLRWVFLVGDHEVPPNGVNDIIGDWRVNNDELEFPNRDTAIVGLLPYMDLNDDGIPDIFVGRLPASSANDVTNYVTKVLWHDTSADPTYGRALMLVGDEDIGVDTGAWVRGLADDLFQNSVHWGVKQAVYATDVVGGFPQRETEALAKWNEGPGLVVTLGTYSGWWLLTSFFHLCYSWNVSHLPYTTKFPAVLALSCGSAGTDIGHNAATWDCQARPVAEQLLMGEPNRGAVVFIGPTRGTKQMPNVTFARHLCTNVDRGDRTWGEVMTHGMRDMLVFDPIFDEHVFEYVLEGDPAVTVAHATPPTDAQAGGVNEMVLGAYPSPTRGGAQVRYNLRQGVPVEIKVVDVAGRQVRALQKAFQLPGSYSVTWDGTDGRGNPVAAGVYVFSLRLGSTRSMKKIVVTR